MVWINVPILPSEYQKLELSEKFGVIVELNYQIVVSNLRSLVAKVKANTRELAKDHKEIGQIFKQIFSFLSNKPTKELINDLKGFSFVPYKRNENHLDFIEPKFFFKDIKKTEIVDGYIYKLPSAFEDNWKLFSELGASNKPNFKYLKNLLEDFGDKSNNNPLNPNEFREVCIVLCHILCGGFKGDEIEIKDILIPNHLKILKKLNDLYYIDKASLKFLLKKSKKIREKCIFDIECLNALSEIKSKIFANFEAITGLKKDDYIYEGEFKVPFDWSWIFDNFPMFSKYKPKPLSLTIVKKLKEKSKVLEKASVLQEISEKIKDTEFLKTLESLVTQSCEFSIKSILEKISIDVYTVDSIKFHYEFKDGAIIDNSEIQEDFFVVHDDDKTMVLKSDSTVDLFEFYNFIAEAIWISIIDQIDSSENSKKLKNKLVLLNKITVKLLFSQKSAYGSVLERFDFKSFMNANVRDLFSVGPRS